MTDGFGTTRDLETRILGEVVLRDPVEVEARLSRRRRDRQAVIQGLGIAAVVVGLFGGLHAVAVKVDEMRQRTHQIEASLSAEPTEVPKTEKTPRYYVDDLGKLWDVGSERVARRRGWRPATDEDIVRHNAAIDAEQAAAKPRVEYRVIENHLVKFERGQAPYIYSMPYDLEQR
jgi:hypothetical protein